MRERGWIGAALALGLLALVSGATAVPAPLSIDETAYQLMARDWLARGDLEIWNGYDELPSPELELRVPGLATQVSAHQGRLVSQYPFLTPLIAAPFYALGGFSGLQWLSALSAAGATLLAMALARRAAPGSAAPAMTGIILIGGSFFWTYAQSAWPHTLTALLAMGAFALGELALGELGPARGPGEERRRRLFAAGAGLTLGLGCCVRLDMALILVALVAGWLASGRRGLALSGAAALGAAPGLLLLALTNRWKFGIFAPFTYGNSVANTAGAAVYLAPVGLALALGASGALLGWAWRAPAERRRGRLVLGLLVPLLMLSIPALREPLIRLLRGATALLLDLRLLGPQPEDAGSQRLTSGALIYWGALKKGLLQSCPALGALTAAFALGAGPRRRLIGRLLLPTALFAAALGWTGFHGDASLNLRYLEPTLPMLALALALVCEPLLAGTGASATGGLGMAAVLALWIATRPDWILDERLWLDAPLALGAALALLGMFLGDRPRLRLPFAALAGAALVVGGAAAFAVDLRVDRDRRQQHLRLAEEIGPLLSDDSLLFGATAASMSALVEGRRLRLALPALDGGADMGRLVAVGAAAGRASYSLLPERLERSLAARGALDVVRAKTLWSSGDLTLRQLIPAAPATDEPGPPR